MIGPGPAPSRRTRAIGVVAALLAIAAAAHAQVIGPPAGAPRPGQIFDRLRESTTRSVPSPGPPSTPAPDMIWVPDRDRMVPGIDTPVRVPGHWERRLSDREFYVPPLVGIAPDGRTVQIPPGVRTLSDPAQLP